MKTLDEKYIASHHKEEEIRAYFTNYLTYTFKIPREAAKALEFMHYHTQKRSMYEYIDKSYVFELYIKDFIDNMPVYHSPTA